MNKMIWDGGYYQVTLYFEELSKAKQAIQFLFGSSLLGMKYNEKTLDKAITVLGGNSFYSSVQILGHDIPCYVSALEFDDKTSELTIGVAMGMLDSIFKTGGYPFEGTSNKDTSEWQISINEVLREIAENLYQNYQFKIAIVGFETFEDSYEIDELLANIPEKRWYGFLIPSNGNLKWFPPTEYKPPVT